MHSVYTYAMADLKKIACEYIDTNAGTLHTLSKSIWENPEIAYEEFKAHDLLTNFFENAGFDVTKQFHLQTAFRATSHSKVKGPNVSVLCEYDALPEIGHACGHNLIAEVGVAASLAIKTALNASEKPLGQVTTLCLGCGI